MTGQDMIRYIKKNHYEDHELLIKIDNENGQVIITFKPQEENDETYFEL